MTLDEWIKENGHGECSRLARALGVDPSLVDHWHRGTQPIPVAQCPGIVAATRWSVTLGELRPDIEWLVLGNQVFASVGRI